MGYASDIDLILIVDGKGELPTASARSSSTPNTCRHSSPTLTNPGTGGPLYSVDLRLRPYGRVARSCTHSGSSGSYVTSEQSQVWEHQALIRSSPVAGDAELGEEIVHFIRQHLGRGLTPEEIFQEMKAMHSSSQGGGAPHPGGLLGEDGSGGNPRHRVPGAERHPHEPHPRQGSCGSRTLTRRCSCSRKHGIITGPEHSALSTAYSFPAAHREPAIDAASRLGACGLDRRLLPARSRSRIGYDRTAPESVMLDEIRYHTAKVRQIFPGHTS